MSNLLNRVFTVEPWFITGFTDAEGCFFVGIQKSNKVRTGWEIQPEFKIELHSKDISLLEKFKEFFKGVGNISHKGDKAAYHVKSLKDLEAIIIHFDNYPLITNKSADYALFKSIYQLLLSKEHLTKEGLLKILSFKASLNKGLSLKLKEYFPDIIGKPRLGGSINKIPNIQWLSGFVSGEGCFLIDIYKSNTTIGVGVTLRFKIAQHSRDSVLMKQLEQYLGCGKYYSKSTDDVGEYIVSKFPDIRDKIIPLFDNNIIGVKHSDFKDFKEAASLIETKSHLTSIGLKHILSLKAGMNRGRKI